jgi:hypothetical protein
MRRLRFGIRSLLTATALVAALQARDLFPDAQRGSPVGPVATPEIGSALLMGTIVDSLTDRPVGEVLVTIEGNRQVLTDAQGRFVFTDLPKGTYTITATKRGYSEGAFGRRRPAGPVQVLPLADAERIGSLKIPIWKNGSITGTITDDGGEPMVGLPVRVLRRTFVAGKRKLSPGTTVNTDDRGVYRVGSLTPGDYVVVVPSTQTTAPESVVDLLRQAAAASGGFSDLQRELSLSGALNGLNTITSVGGLKVGTLVFQSLITWRGGILPMPSADGRIFVYPTQYHPGAMTAAQASTIALRSGEDRSGVDLQLRLVGTSRVSGTVTGPDGPLSVGLSLVVNSDDFSTDTDLETAKTWSDAAGRFTFLGVPPGQCLLRLLKLPLGPSRGGGPPSTPSTLTLWATQPVTVDASDIRDVAVTLRPGFRISGSLKFDDAANEPAPEVVRRITATFESADARPMAYVTGRGPFNEDGEFSSVQLPPTRYFLRVNNPPPGWTLKSAMFEGRDISNLPLSLERDAAGVVVTFTNRPSELNGQAQGASGAADATATVLIFPAESAAWLDYGETPRRLRAIRVDKDGAYRTAGLPAGDYFAVAIADESAGNWQDPKTLQALARLATAVKLGDGEIRSLELKTVAVPR